MAQPRTNAPALATMLPMWLDFLLAQRGLSSNTVEAYGQDLESFFLYRQELAQGADPQSLPDPDEQEIFLYLAWLRARQNTGRTLARRLSALRAFFAFAVDEGRLKKNPAELLENPKLPQHLPEVLTRDEMEALLAQPDLRDKSGKRDRCMLNFCTPLACAYLSCAPCVCLILICNAALCVFLARAQKKGLCRCTT